MASTSNEKMSARTQEFFGLSHVGVSSVQAGTSSGGLWTANSGGANQYNIAVQTHARVHLTPSPVSPRVPSPPPGYEDAPVPLVHDTSRDVEIQQTRVPAPEHLRPKEFPDSYDYHHHGVVDAPRTKSFWRTRKGIIFIVVVSNVIILCAILGGVMGSMSAMKSLSGGDGNATHAGGSGGTTRSQLYTSSLSSTSSASSSLSASISSYYTTSSSSSSYTTSSSSYTTSSSSSLTTSSSSFTTSTSSIVLTSTVTATVTISASTGGGFPSIGAVLGGS